MALLSEQQREQRAYKKICDMCSMWHELPEGVV